MKRIDVIIKTTKLDDVNSAFRICTEETGDDAVRASRLRFIVRQLGCTLGEDMLDTMCINNSRTLVMILHGMLSSISLKLELSVSQSRYNALTKLVSCEELVKNW